MIINYPITSTTKWLLIIIHIHLQHCAFPAIKENQFSFLTELLLKGLIKLHDTAAWVQIRKTQRYKPLPRKTFTILPFPLAMLSNSSWSFPFLASFYSNSISSSSRVHAQKSTSTYKNKRNTLNLLWTARITYFSHNSPKQQWATNIFSRRISWYYILKCGKHV